ncbi:MAG TPA: hypothetical protein VEI52_12645 [Terriglobales bacterium]|nr:hypothetical protein [Terriglobales bacterium]
MGATTVTCDSKEIGHEKVHESNRYAGPQIRRHRADLKTQAGGLVFASDIGLRRQGDQGRSVTYIVGTCKSGTQFSTIQSALDASPAASAVQICPGTCPEQITITNPVTLEGISEGNSSAARIVPPAAGLSENATVNGGDAAFAQVHVKSVSGAVDLTSLYVDGSGNNVSNNIFDRGSLPAVLGNGQPRGHL